MEEKKLETWKKLEFSKDFAACNVHVIQGISYDIDFNFPLAPPFRIHHSYSHNHTSECDFVTLVCVLRQSETQAALQWQKYPLLNILKIIYLFLYSVLVTLIDADRHLW